MNTKKNYIKKGLKWLSRYEGSNNTHGRRQSKGDLRLKEML